MVSLVSAVAPIMNTSRISPTTAYYNTNLLGYCNASDGDSDTLTYYYKWWNGTSLYENGNESVSESFSITSSTESVFNSGITYYPSLTELSDGRLAVAYRDNGNSDYGTFAICNSSGGSCTESVFNSGTTYDTSITELSDGRLAVAYRDVSNSSYGTFAICNSSGGSCTESVFNSGATISISLTELSDGRLAVAYRDNGNSAYGTFAICNSSGGSCTESVFNSGTTDYASITELNDGRLAVAYRDASNSSYGTLAICDSVGGSCTESVFNSGDNYYISMTELNDGRLAIAYRDVGNSNYGTLAICNSSGGSCTESVFNSYTTDYTSLTELSDGRLAVAYQDGSNSDYGTFAICNSSGGSCTETVFNSGSTTYTSLTELNDGRLAIAYRDASNSNFGTLAITNVLTQSFTESTEYLINTLPNTYTNKDEVWTFTCLANDGNENSSWLNSTSIIISNTAPSFTQINYSNTISHNTSIASQINATDSDSDSLTFTINDSDFDINSSGYLNKTNDLSKVGTYNISVNVTDATDITQGWIYYDITNTKPQVDLITIVNSGNLTFTNSSSDSDGDLITLYDIRWYVKDTLKTAFNNLSLIESGNLSLNENYTVSLRAYDSLLWSDWFNSSQTTIGDTTPPVLSDDYLSSSSGTNDALFNIYVNVSETNSIGFVYVEIQDPNLIKTNYTMFLSEGASNEGKYIKAFTPSTDGTYHFQFYAQDGTGNLVTLNSTLTYAESTSIPEVGGGGGSTTTIFDTSSDIDFIITPLIETIKIAPGDSRIIEFTIENSNSEDIIAFIGIEPNQIQEWMLLQNGGTFYYVNVSKGVGLESNTKFIRYNVKVPVGTQLGNYTGKIKIQVGANIQYHNLNVEVTDSFYIELLKVFNTDLLDLTTTICADSETCNEGEFSSTGESCEVGICQNEKTIGFVLKLYHILLFLVIVTFLVIFINKKPWGKKK